MHEQRVEVGQSAVDQRAAHDLVEVADDRQLPRAGWQSRAIVACH
jgi:hypothetical protein